MIIISYWELNPDLDPTVIGEAAQMLMTKKIYPVAGVKEIAFYVSTSDYWGITIEEAENEEQMAKGSMMWRLAKPGYIRVMKTTPAMDATKIIPLVMKLKKEIKG